MTSLRFVRGALTWSRYFAILEIGFPRRVTSWRRIQPRNRDKSSNWKIYFYQESRDRPEIHGPVLGITFSILLSSHFKILSSFKFSIKSRLSTPLFEIFSTWNLKLFISQRGSEMIFSEFWFTCNQLRALSDSGSKCIFSPAWSRWFSKWSSSKLSKFDNPSIIYKKYSYHIIG